LAGNAQFPLTPALSRRERGGKQLGAASEIKRMGAGQAPFDSVMQRYTYE